MKLRKLLLPLAISLSLLVACSTLSTTPTLPDPLKSICPIIGVQSNSVQTPKIPVKEERYKFWSAGDKYIEVLNEWGVPKARDFWKYYDKVDFRQRKVLFNQKKLALFNDVKSVLERIYNRKDRKRLGIVTNTADYVVDYILKKFRLE